MPRSIAYTLHTFIVPSTYSSRDVLYSHLQLVLFLIVLLATAVAKVVVAAAVAVGGTASASAAAIAAAVCQRVTCTQPNTSCS